MGTCGLIDGGLLWEGDRISKRTICFETRYGGDKARQQPVHAKRVPETAEQLDLLHK